MKKTNDFNDKSSQEDLKDDGLPEIAQDENRKKIIFVCCAAIVVILCLWGKYFYDKEKYTATDNQPQKVEENFVVPGQQDAKKLDSLNRQPDGTNKTNQSHQMTEEQIQLIQQKQKELQQRLSAPLMLVDNTQNEAPKDKSSLSSSNGDQNTQFLNQVSSEKTGSAIASVIDHLNYKILQGTLIDAVLEPMINSDLPGQLRAIVDTPIYSEDGSQVLIPRGSKLIGQYKSGMQEGQSRVFVVWTRLIIQNSKNGNTNGISIDLGSPGVDGLGGSGLEADDIDRHFWQRFSTAGLLAIIGAGASNVGVSNNDQYNAAQQYRTAVANSFAQSANTSLQQNNAIPPTLVVNQGKHIFVFVNRDLDFESAMKSSMKNINIF